MDSQPFRTNVTNDMGKQIGFVVWAPKDNCWRAYRSAGQPPIGKSSSKDEAIGIVTLADFGVISFGDRE